MPAMCNAFVWFHTRMVSTREIHKYARGINYISRALWAILSKLLTSMTLDKIFRVPI